MLSKKDHIRIGQLNKPRGVNGEFNVSFLPNYQVEEFIDVVLVEYDNYLVPFFVEDLALGKDNTGHIKFDHIHAVEACTPFVNCNLFAPNNHHIQVDSPQNASAMIDYKVQDQSGKDLGLVIDFIDTPNNPLLEIQNAQGDFLMPLNEDFFVNIDKKAKIIVVNLPEGLINLNE